jgi:hypothetical protein
MTMAPVGAQTKAIATGEFASNFLATSRKAARFRSRVIEADGRNEGNGPNEESARKFHESWRGRNGYEIWANPKSFE